MGSHFTAYTPSSSNSSLNSKMDSSTLNRKRNCPFSSSSISDIADSLNCPSSSSSSSTSSSLSPSSLSSSFKKFKPFSSSSSTLCLSSSSIAIPLRSSSSSSSSLLWQMPMTTLSMYLQLLDKDQMIAMLLQFTKNSSTHELFLTHLPPPSVSFILNHLNSLEKKLIESLPYIRSVSSHSSSSFLSPSISTISTSSFSSASSSSSPIVFNDYAFNRVRPILNELQSTLLQFLDYFFHTTSTAFLSTTTKPTSSLSPISSINDWILFLYETTCLVCRLPQWESSTSSLSKNTTSNSNPSSNSSSNSNSPFSSSSSSSSLSFSTSHSLLETLNQYWKTTFHLLPSCFSALEKEDQLKFEDFKCLEKWVHYLEEINVTSRGYFQDVLNSFEPFVRALSSRIWSSSSSSLSSASSISFLPCGLFSHPNSHSSSSITSFSVPEVSTSFSTGMAPLFRTDKEWGSSFFSSSSSSSSSSLSSASKFTTSSSFSLLSFSSSFDSRK